MEREQSIPTALPSSEDASKEKENALVEQQTIAEKKISDLLNFIKNDLGVMVRFGENDEDELFFVSRVLDMKKMDVNKSKRYIFKYFKIRCQGGDFFKNRTSDSDEILKSCQSVYLFTLPVLTKGGQRIVYSKIAPGVKAEDFDQKAFFKRFLMASDIRFMEDKKSNSDLFILDMEGFTKYHAMKVLNSGLLSKFVKTLKDTYPRRLHAIHVIRTKPWHKSAIGLWLKVAGASKKVLERIKIHSIQEQGLEGLGVQMEQLSGRLQDLNDAWTQRLIARSTWFESQEATFKTITLKNVKLEKQKEKNNLSEDLYISPHSEIYTFKSLEGIFRQIEIDDTNDLEIVDSIAK